MPNVLFPTLTMPTGSYTWPIAKYEEYSTIVLPSASMRGEMGKSLSLYPIWHFDLDFALLAGDLNILTSAVASVVGFHMQMRGSYSTWLFNDPYDNLTNGNVQFGIGDGATLAFQLIRPIAGGTDIIQNVNGPPTILVNDVVQSAGAYTVSPLGVVTFTTAPGAGLTLKWNGAFYFRCRFDSDKLQDLRQVAPSTWDIHSVQFHSVIL